MRQYVSAWCKKTHFKESKDIDIFKKAVVKSLTFPVLSLLLQLHLKGSGKFIDALQIPTKNMIMALFRCVFH